MELPHERYHDLWDRAFSNCSYIREFCWQSILPIPATILKGLSSKTQLRTLSIPGDNISNEQSVKYLGSIQGLEKTMLTTPDRPLESILVSWLNSLSDSLTCLHIEVKTLYPMKSPSELSSYHMTRQSTECDMAGRLSPSTTSTTSTQVSDTPRLPSTHTYWDPSSPVSSSIKPRTSLPRSL